MHVGVTDARESQDARASRCSDASVQNETRAFERTVSFRDKNLSTLAPYLGASIPSVGKISSMDENGWIGSKRPLRLYLYIYIYIYSRDREVIRADANGGRRIPSRSSLVRIRLGRGLLCPLITIHLSQAVEHFSGSTSGQCELQLHRLSTAPPHLTKPRATNCNPCKHDDPRCVSLHRLTTSFPLPTLPPPTLPPSFLPSFLGRAPFLTISRTRRSPTTRLALSYLRSSVSLSFSSFLFPLHPFLA